MEPIGEMTVRKAWGRTTVPRVWAKLIPRLRAASPCPRGTVLMPERSTSQTKAEV